MSPAPADPHDAGRSQAQDRRAAPRTQVPERPAVRVRGLRDVCLMDLSIAGARIEHLAPLRPGVAYTLELPLPCGALALPAEVVWCTVVAKRRTLGGETHLVARSGLRFSPLAPAKQAALADTLQELVEALRPIA